MPAGPRLLTEHACYHITTRGNQRQLVFLDSTVKIIVRFLNLYYGRREAILEQRAELKRKTILEKRTLDGRMDKTGAETSLKLLELLYCSLLTNQAF